MMTKREFIQKLREGLSGLPQADIEERVIFYGEMIDDRVEDGLSEEEAVSEIGNVEEITLQIIEETPLTKIVREKIRPKGKVKAWQIVLIAVGSPIWASLLIVAIAVIFSIWVSLWAVIVSLWASDAALAASALGAIIEGVILIFTGYALSGLFAFGGGLVCAGLFIFLLFGCKAATKGLVILTKKILIGIKRIFVGKEDENE